MRSWVYPSEAGRTRRSVRFFGIYCDPLDNRSVSSASAGPRRPKFISGRMWALNTAMPRYLIRFFFFADA